jgi:hypothetical protein
MRFLRTVFWSAFLFCCVPLMALRNVDFNKADIIHEGDIIFQTSMSAQSKAIQLATNSKYSHVGIIFKNQGRLDVYEAIQPVTYTKLEDWIQRGKNKHYVVKRLKNSEALINTGSLQRLKNAGKKFKGKDYDKYFEWSDDRVYCSELVWKIYKNALNIEIGKLEKLSEFNLTDPVVSKKLTERYGRNIPLNENVISPASMFDSENLTTVLEQ